MREGLLGEENLPPDLLEAYQELRTLFWTQFGVHPYAISRTPRSGAAGENRSLALTPNQNQHVLVVLSDLSHEDSEHLFIEGMITVMFEDMDFEFGIDRDNQVVWNKEPIDYNQHGLSPTEAEALTSEERLQRLTDVQENVILEGQHRDLFGLAGIDEVSQLVSWLRDYRLYEEE